MHAVEKRVEAVQTAKELALREIEDFHAAQVADVQRQVEQCLHLKRYTTPTVNFQVQSQLSGLLSRKNELATKAQDLEAILRAVATPLRSR